MPDNGKNPRPVALGLLKYIMYIAGINCCIQQSEIDLDELTTTELARLITQTDATTQH